MYNIQAYSLNGEGLVLSKEINLDTKFKADKSFIGFGKKYDCVFLIEPDNKWSMISGSMDIAKKLIEYYMYSIYKGDI